MDTHEVIPASGGRPGACGLDEWIARHGPLAPEAALVVALDICAHASRLTDAQLAAAIGSLNTSGVARGDRGGWSWAPSATASPARRVTDTEVLERVGAILFHCLTGQALAYPFPVEQALRESLRSLRPQLPNGVADLTVEAVSARHGASLTLPVFARELRRALGVERRPEAGRSRRTMRLVGASMALLAVSLVAWQATGPGAQEQLQTHGLTIRETALLDISAETAQAYALIDEHTAASQQYEQVARLWSTRVAQDDPRLAWNAAHMAWVRSLADDRLTAEQTLEDTPTWLAAQLGDGHPYTRTVRLALATTLEGRGASAEAAALRADAERATRGLLYVNRRALDAVDAAPVPPGVLAHVAPNAPQREGFRRGPDGAFVVPLTSTQQWVAGRDGWRLHIVASGRCRATFVAGRDPRIIAVDVARSADSGWQLSVEGTAPAMTWHEGSADTVGVSLVADGTGALEAWPGDQAPRSLRIDMARTPPDPPYALTFDGGPGGAGCQVVWLEIPFPASAIVRPR